MPPPAFPDGISEQHSRAGPAHAYGAGLIPLLLLGGLMLAALLGIFGGGKNADFRSTGPAAALTVNAPEILRNGEFFEMRIVTVARKAVARPTIAVASGYWRDLTINTMIPSADKEEFADGAFRFEYKAVQPGDRLEIKVDGQVNPSRFGGSKGYVALFDGETELVRTAIALKVLP